MADDLDENYQLEDEFLPSNDAIINSDIEEVTEETKITESIKRKQNEEKSKSEIKTKKKNITEILKLKEKELSKASFATKEFKTLIQKHVSSNLSSVEKMEFDLIDESDSSKNKINTQLNKMILKRKQKLVKLGSFWEHFNKKFNFKFKTYFKNSEKPSNKKHAPFMIVLCSSAIRCIELQRELDKNNKYIKNKKISWFHAFAKHKKLNEQIEFLNSEKSKRKNIDLIFATPQRLAQLIEANCFDLEKNLKYVLIDYSHRDVKLKRFVDQNEIKQEFFNLVFKHLIHLNKRKIQFKFYLI
ncbi:unnamed protein product [Brachionus calyciflorus]|uniref:Uncharacterized protein n=1 Tax=Brachionus calyciflorus TaxID=104777 RepID=A0A813W4L1_9BILA|nr:unnamed protein product [Brachionus calyciflorus]